MGKFGKHLFVYEERESNENMPPSRCGDITNIVSERDHATPWMKPFPPGQQLYETPLWFLVLFPNLITCTV